MRRDLQEKAAEREARKKTAKKKVMWDKAAERKAQKKAAKRKVTRKKAAQFVNMIIKRNEDCAIITHGFFMHTLIRMMKNVGFKADKERVNYMAKSEAFGYG